ncbi:copper homeostasis periplasmic binding protein CopC [Burkholderia multivorans]|uniref:copper homeostasis periplasmic binding protein CopC n=1 Tax=Burkholderia multivorans TaxID=87883 RepID=UPI000D00C806|nr:copper homeostasis periplasmic binding protein CopC [Burkholderia multivorans]MBR7891510.1 copper homeostasis periplasmic binding protein CopC [Burkholderia multivorans]MBR8452889.1 copper homeostasis periplasmic binding protein CopC [Burkholderia multivorans]MBU9448547.1 copper homeostasis periplasmic binding protein CopC [Burkholderia multivorans]MCL4648030.1 copper homeostasis periplasmic binding protein CopC [Burkholderia multivorans]PRG32879.1 copper resistance protein CopC [Burkholder
MRFDPSLLGRRAAAVLFAATVSSAAFAHAHVAKSDPAANAMLAAAPAAVTIDFTETLEPAFSSIVVVDGGGKTVSDGRARVDAGDRKRMTVPLSALGAGAYTVKWVAVATDGHRTQGSYGFSVK